MFFKKYGDLVVSIFFMVLSAVMIYAAKLLPKSKVMEIGPDFMPTVIGALTFILAAILFVLTVKNLKSNIAKAEASEVEECEYRQMLISLLLILVYVFTLQPIGFIVTTIVYLPCQMLVLAGKGNRTKKDIISVTVISVIFTFVVFFLFRYGFKIVLPAGIFTINI